MQTVWGNDQRFVSTYWQSFAGRLVYSTFDWGIKDEDGYWIEIVEAAMLKVLGQPD
jgi:propionyl-CoA synthetase